MQMNPKVEEIFKKLSEDHTLAHNILTADSAQDAKELAVEAGLELTEDNLKELSSVLQEELKKQMSQGETLSDDDLDNVSGGVIIDTAAVTTAAAVVGAAISGYCVANSAVQQATGKGIVGNAVSLGNDAAHSIYNAISSW